MEQRIILDSPSARPQRSAENSFMRRYFALTSSNMKTPFYIIALIFGLHLVASATHFELVESEADGIVELRNLAPTDLKLSVFLVSSSITSVVFEENGPIATIKLTISEVSTNSTRAGTGVSYWLQFEDMKTAKKALNDILAEIKFRKD